MEATLKKEAKDLWAGIAVILAVVIGLVMWFDNGTTNATPEASVPEATTPAGPVLPLGQHVIKDTTFGCSTPEAFKDASSYWSNHERSLLDGMFTSGQCEWLKKGETVILVDVSFMDHIVVRRVGEATPLVTFQSAF